MDSLVNKALYQKKKNAMYCWWCLRHRQAELLVLIHHRMQLTVVQRKKVAAMCRSFRDIIVSQRAKFMNELYIARTTPSSNFYYSKMPFVFARVLL